MFLAALFLPKGRSSALGVCPGAAVLSLCTVSLAVTLRVPGRLQEGEQGLRAVPSLPSALW